MALQFDSTTHTYTNDDGKELISITTLLAKHHLAPDYSNVVNIETYATRGTLIHEELHNYITKGEIGFTQECQDFAKYCEENNIEFIDSEFMLYNDHIAGTCDFLYKNKEGELCRADFKTTATKHTDSVSWQLSLYDYLDTRKAKHLYLWHFGKEGLEVVEVRPKEIVEIEKLIEDDKKGEIYTPTLALSLQSQQEILALQQTLQELEDTKKQISAKLEDFKAKLLEEMETHNIKKIDTSYFSITYVAPASVIRIDTTRLKKEQPEIYKTYSKEATNKAYVKITLKGDKE